MLQGLIREVAGSKSGGPKKGFQAGDTSSPTGLSHTPLAAGGFPPQLWSLRWTQTGATPVLSLPQASLWMLPLPC